MPKRGTTHFIAYAARLQLQLSIILSLRGVPRMGRSSLATQGVFLGKGSRNGVACELKTASLARTKKTFSRALGTEQSMSYLLHHTILRIIIHFVAHGPDYRTVLYVYVAHEMDAAKNLTVAAYNLLQQIYSARENALARSVYEATRRIATSGSNATSHIVDDKRYCSRSLPADYSIPVA